LHAKASFLAEVAMSAKRHCGEKIGSCGLRRLARRGVRVATLHDETTHLIHDASLHVVACGRPSSLPALSADPSAHSSRMRTDFERSRALVRLARE